jgi:hypothetical protein
MRQEAGGGFHVLVKSTVLDWAVKHAGAPETVWLDIRSRADDPDLHIDLLLVNKTATRLPEVSATLF